MSEWEKHHRILVNLPENVDNNWKPIWVITDEEYNNVGWEKCHLDIWKPVRKGN